MNTRGRPMMRIKIGGVVLFAVTTGIIVSLSPKDETLGAIVRFLYFHGALTWVNLATFSLAALTGIVFLFRGDLRWYRWGSAFRYISLALWTANTWMGIESMIWIWGGVKWDEPRLRMTFWIMLAALLLIAIDLLAHRFELTAVLDVALAALVWVLLLTTPMEFHPDSPVLHSSARIIAFFAAMVVSSAGMTFTGAWLLRDRLGRDDAEAT